MDNLSALISSFQRMLDEPKSRHRAVDNLNRFIVQNYLVAAHVAAARIQVRQHYDELDIPAAEAAIEQATEAARNSLQLASERLHADERGGGRGAGFIRRERAPVGGEVQAPLAVAAGPVVADVAEAEEDAAAERRARLADSADKRRTDTLVQAAAAGESSEQAGPTSSSTGRPANAVLERRLRALREDAAKIALRTGAIGRAMRARD
ncbi:hypothetical protein D9M72_475370 [compost metagenome]